LIFESNLGFEQLVAQFSIGGAFGLQASRNHWVLSPRAKSFYTAGRGSCGSVELRRTELAASYAILRSRARVSKRFCGSAESHGRGTGLRIASGHRRLVPRSGATKPAWHT
jgi:hypothetical protein